VGLISETNGFQSQVMVTWRKTPSFLDRRWRKSNTGGAQVSVRAEPGWSSADCDGGQAVPVTTGHLHLWPPQRCPSLC
jgi:hypothetical protein